MDLLIAAQVHRANQSPDASSSPSAKAPASTAMASHLMRPTPNDSSRAVTKVTAAPRDPPSRTPPSTTKSSSGKGGRFHQGVGGNHNNRVCLLNLVTAGLLAPASRVSFRNHHAIVSSQGTLRPDPLDPLSPEMLPEYETPSAWATAVCKMGRHGRVAVNGWSSVKVVVSCDQFESLPRDIEVPLDALRQKYLASTSGSVELARLPLTHFLGDSRKRKLRTDVGEGARSATKARKHSTTAVGASPDCSLLQARKGHAANLRVDVAGPTPTNSRPMAQITSAPLPKRKPSRPAKSLASAVGPTGGPHRLGRTASNDGSRTGVTDGTLADIHADAQRKATGQRLRTKRRKKLTMKILSWLDFRRSTRGVPWAFPALRRQRVATGASIETGDGDTVLTACQFAVHNVYPNQTPLVTEPTPCTACANVVVKPDTDPLGRQGNFHCSLCDADYHWVCAGHALTSLSDSPRSSASTEPSDSTLLSGTKRLPGSVLYRCASCAVCAACHQGSPLNQLVQCDHCPTLIHVDCLSDAAIECVRQCRRWVCHQCVQCHECGTSDPQGVVITEDGMDDDDDVYWAFDYTLCAPCGKLLEKGNLCPLCQGVYRDDDYDTPMIACDSCACWIHSACDPLLTPEKYQQLVVDEESQYFCPICRKEQDEVLFWTLPISFERERVWVAAAGGIRASFRPELRDQYSSKTRPLHHRLINGADRWAKPIAPGDPFLELTSLTSAQVQWDMELDLCPQYDVSRPLFSAHSGSVHRYGRGSISSTGSAQTTGGDSGLHDLLLAATDSAPAQVPVHSRLRSASTDFSTFGPPPQLHRPSTWHRVDPLPPPPPTAAEPLQSSVVDAAEMLLSLFSTEPTPSPAPSMAPSAQSTPTPPLEPPLSTAPLSAGPRPLPVPSLPAIDETGPRRPSIAALLSSPPLASTPNSKADTIKCVLCHGKEMAAPAAQLPALEGDRNGVMPTPPTSSGIGKSPPSSSSMQFGTGRLMFLYSRTYPEAWAHIDCILWLPDIRINDRYEVDGIEAALVRAQRSRCQLCSRLGATVKCAASPQCTVSYHISCLFVKAQHLFASENLPNLYYDLRCLLCPTHAPTHNTLFTTETKLARESSERPRHMDHNSLTIPDSRYNSPTPSQPDESSALLVNPEPSTEPSGWQIGGLYIPRSTAWSLKSLNDGKENYAEDVAFSRVVVTLDCPRLIAPRGFQCQRRFWSYQRPSQHTTITCEVVAVNPMGPTLLCDQMPGAPVQQLEFASEWRLQVADDWSASGTILAPTLPCALRALLSRYVRGPLAAALAASSDQHAFLRDPARFVGLDHPTIVQHLDATVEHYHRLREWLDLTALTADRSLIQTTAQQYLAEAEDAPTSMLPPMHPTVKVDATCTAARTDLVYRRRVPGLARGAASINAFGGVNFAPLRAAVQALPSPQASPSAKELSADDQLYTELSSRDGPKSSWALAPSECYNRTIVALGELTDSEYQRIVKRSVGGGPALATASSSPVSDELHLVTPLTHLLPASVFQSHYYMNRSASVLTGLGLAGNGGNARQRASQATQLAPRTLFPSSTPCSSVSISPKSTRPPSPSLYPDDHGTGASELALLGAEVDGALASLGDEATVEPTKPSLRLYGSFTHRPHQDAIVSASPDPVGLGPVVNRIATGGVGAFFKVVGTVRPSSDGNPRQAVHSDNYWVSTALKATHLADLSQGYWTGRSAATRQSSGGMPFPPSQATLGLYTTCSFDKDEAVLEFVGELLGSHQSAQRQRQFFATARHIVGDRLVRGKASGHVGRPRQGSKFLEKASDSDRLPAQQYPHCIMVRASRDWFIDASRTQGPCTYLQHSAKPNLYPRTLCLSTGAIHVVLCAARHIDADEELTLRFE
ncbi:hypothetical protein H4R34_004507 [Dimargaris verticillata]|uniref:Uncharacterized protein n=1 Tax=Dimargaris verticillata TaxID=2761393 RepID=A0A9W8AY53_9FUNG|nr:hypothetical protein H4R34_004507 [Dimargaris verticillata]